VSYLQLEANISIKVSSENGAGTQSWGDFATFCISMIDRVPSAPDALKASSNEACFPPGLGDLVLIGKSMCAITGL